MAQRVQIVIEADATQAQKVIDTLNANLGNIGSAAFKPQIDAVNKLSDGMLKAVAVSDQLVRTGYRLTLGLSGPLLAAATYATKLGANVEAARVSFEVLSGSIQVATRHLEELKAFAESKPFDFSDVLSLSRYLQAAGFQINQVIPLLNSLGNAIAAVGSGENLDKIVLQLVHIENLGRVTLRELNPLARAGIPVFELLAEAIKKPGEEADKTNLRLRNLLKSSSIPGPEFINYFTAALSARFPEGLKKASETLKGQFQILKNTISIAAADLGEAFAPAVIIIVKAISQLVTAASVAIKIFASLPESVRAIIGLLIAFAGVIGPIILSIGYFTRGLTSLSQLFSKLSSAVTLNTGVQSVNATATNASATAKNAEAAASSKLTQALAAENAVRASSGTFAGLPTQLSLYEQDVVKSKSLVSAEKAYNAANLAKENALAELALSTQILDIAKRRKSIEDQVAVLRADVASAAGRPTFSSLETQIAKEKKLHDLESQLALAGDTTASVAALRVSNARRSVNAAERRGVFAAQNLAAQVSPLPEQLALFPKEQLEGFKLAGKDFEATGIAAAGAASNVSRLIGTFAKFSVIAGAVLFLAEEIVKGFNKFKDTIPVIQELDSYINKFGISAKNFSDIFSGIGLLISKELQSIVEAIAKTSGVSGVQATALGSAIGVGISRGFRLSFHPSEIVDLIQDGLLVAVDKIRNFSQNNPGFKVDIVKSIFGDNAVSAKIIKAIQEVQEVQKKADDSAQKAAIDKKNKAEQELRDGINRRLAEQEYARLLELVDQSERKAREYAIEAEAKQLGGLLRINDEMAKYIDRLTTHIFKLPGSELPQEVHIALTPTTQINLIKGYLSEIFDLQQKTQKEIADEAFKIDDQVYKHKIDQVESFSKSQISILEAQQASELISAQAVADKSFQITKLSAEQKFTLQEDLFNKQASRDKEAIEAERKKLAITKESYQDIYNLAFTQSKTTENPQGNTLEALQLTGVYVNKRLELDKQLQAKEKELEIKTADEIAAARYQKELDIHNAAVKRIIDENKLYIDLQEKEQAAAAASAQKILEIQKQAIDSRKQAELQALEFITPLSIQQAIDISNRRAAVSQQALALETQNELAAIKLRTAEDIRVRKTQLEKETSDREEIEKQLNILREAGAKEELLTTSKAIDTLGSLQRQAALDQLKIVRQNAESVFDSIKSSSDRFLDQTLSKSKSVFGAIGDAIKGAFISTFKSIISSQIAKQLTQLVTGQNVQFETAGTTGSVGGFGNILARLGLGRRVVNAQGQVPVTATGPSAEQLQIAFEAALRNYQIAAAAAKPKQQEIPAPPTPPPGYNQQLPDISPTLKQLADSLGGDLGKIRLEQGSVPVVIKQLDELAKAFAASQNPIESRLVALDEESAEMLRILRKMETTQPTAPPTASDEAIRKAYENLGIPYLPSTPRIGLGVKPSVPAPPPGAYTNPQNPFGVNLKDYLDKQQDIQKIIINEAAQSKQKYGYEVPASLALAVAKEESGYRQVPAYTGNAFGVFQLKPETAATLHVDAKDTLQNIQGGVKLLSQYLARYDGDVVKTLQAFGSGPFAAEHGGVTDETKNAITKILQYQTELQGLKESSQTNVATPSSKYIDNSVDSAVSAITNFFSPKVTEVGRFSKTPIFRGGSSPNGPGIKGEYFRDTNTIGLYTNDLNISLHEQLHALLENSIGYQTANSFLPFSALAKGTSILNAYNPGYAKEGQTSGELVPRLVSGQGYSLGLTQLQSDEAVNKLLSGLRQLNTDQGRELANTFAEIYSLGKTTGYGPIADLPGQRISHDSTYSILKGLSSKYQLPDGLGPKPKSESLSVTLASDEVSYELNQYKQLGGAQYLQGPGITSGFGNAVTFAPTVSAPTAGAVAAPAVSAPTGILGTFLPPQLASNIQGNINAVSGAVSQATTLPSASGLGFNPLPYVPGFFAGSTSRNPLEGSAIGALFGGTFGKGIGGALLGASSGLLGFAQAALAPTASQHIKDAVKNSYGIALDNNASDALANIINSQFGGNVQLGLRSQATRQFLERYAAANGQKFGQKNSLSFGQLFQDRFKTLIGPGLLAAAPAIQGFIGNLVNPPAVGKLNASLPSRILDLSNLFTPGLDSNAYSDVSGAAAPSLDTTSSIGNIPYATSQLPSTLSSTSEAVAPIGNTGYGITQNNQIAQVTGTSPSGGLLGKVLNPILGNSVKSILSGKGLLNYFYQSKDIYLRSGVATTTAGIAQSLGGGIFGHAIGGLAGFAASPAGGAIGSALFFNGLRTPAGVGSGLQLAGGGALLGASIGSHIGAIGIGGGALLGAGIGLVAQGLKTGGVVGLIEDIGGGAIAGSKFGPVGAIIGAGIGATLGAFRLTGIISSKWEQIQQQVKATYNLDVPKSFAVQLQGIIDQKYGGSISQGIRSTEVLNLLAQFAAISGQQFGIANKPRATTLIQTTNGLTQQAVYENNKALSFANLPVYGGINTTTILPAQKLASGEIAPYQQLPGNGTAFVLANTGSSNAPGPNAASPASAAPGAGVTVVVNNSLPAESVGDYFDGRTVRTVAGNPAAVSQAYTAAIRQNINRRSNATSLINPNELTT